MVVDIQGVGDLYTDPQIHTARGTEYGDGNLGTKGMALFFHSHHCNDICMSLGLTPFDLSQEENQQLKNSVKRFSSTSETRVKGMVCNVPWNQILTDQTTNNISSAHKSGVKC